MSPEASTSKAAVWLSEPTVTNALYTPAAGLVTADVLVRIVQYSVVAVRAVMLEILIVVPEPLAVREPGSSVALGKYVVQPVLLIDCVALTVPEPKLLKFTLAVVAPAPEVLKSSAKAWPVLAIIGLAFDAPPIS